MICCTCKEDKQELFFGKNSQGRLKSNCNDCRKKYAAEHYQRNKNAYIARGTENTKKYIKRNRDFVDDAKQHLECKSCGNNHPAVLDFHHNDPLIKEENVGSVRYSGCSIEKIQKEIDKCTILCANCHRVHHYNEGHQKQLQS